MTRFSILIPAAGASRRMQGRDKLLEPVDGDPLLRRQVRRALATGARVLVTLPRADHPRADALTGLDVAVVPAPDADEGMAASIRAGIAALSPGTPGVAILPADMPDIRTDDLLALMDRFETEGGQAVVQAAGADGTPGHPVLFPADCIPALLQIKGDVGARAVLRAEQDRLIRVSLAGQRALTDLDTPTAWNAWRAAQTGKTC